MNRITILLAEDEPVLGKLIKEALERKSYHVLWAEDGQKGYELYRTNQPDLCILDVMMPAINGYELAAMIRKLSGEVPLLFLTARSATSDVVKGFEAGGNDYLRKPFSLEELMLRIQELLRRKTGRPDNHNDNIAETYLLGIYQFNPVTQILKSDKENLKLSFKESELLKALILHKNDLLLRKNALIKLWGDDTFFNSRTMDVYIAKLRKYLQNDPRLSILNIRGYGYKLLENDE